MWAAGRPTTQRTGRGPAFVQKSTEINLYLPAGPGLQGAAPGSFGAPVPTIVSETGRGSETHPRFCNECGAQFLVCRPHGSGRC
jgi:hypothetical protein